MAGGDREYIYRLVFDVDGNMRPEFRKMIGETRKSLDELDIGGMKLSKNFLAMGKDMDFSFNSIINGYQMISSGAVSAGTAVSSFGIGLAASLGSMAVKGTINAVKWGMEQTVDIIKEGTKSAADFELAMVGVSKVLPELRGQGGAPTALYGEYQSDIERLVVETYGIDFAGAAALFESGARGGVGRGMEPEERRDALNEYAQTAAMLSVAYDTDPESAGGILRNWRTVQGLSDEDSKLLMDQINTLDNLFNSDAVEIAKVLAEKGSLLSASGWQRQDIAAIAAVSGLDGTFMGADESGTALQSINRAMIDAGRGGGLRGDARDALGISQSEINAAMKHSAMDAFMLILDKAAQVENSVERSRLLYNYFGANAAPEVAKIMGDIDSPGFARNVETLKEAIAALNNPELIAQNSVASEFGVRQGTAAADWEEFQESWQLFQMNAARPFMEGLQATWDRDGDGILEGLDATSAKFTEMATTIFAEGGSFDILMGLVPRAVDLFGDFIDSLTFFLEHPGLALLDAVVPGNAFGAKGWMHNSKGWGPNVEVSDNEDVQDAITRLYSGVSTPYSYSSADYGSGNSSLAGTLWDLKRDSDEKPIIPHDYVQSRAMMAGLSTGTSITGEEINALTKALDADTQITQVIPAVFEVNPPAHTVQATASSHDTYNFGGININAMDVGGDPYQAGRLAGKGVEDYLNERERDAKRTSFRGAPLANPVWGTNP